MLRRLFLLLSCLSIASTLHAQGAPSAEGGGIPLWVGAAVSSFNPDYGCAHSNPFTCTIWGPTIYADVPRLLFHRVGVAGEMRFLRWHGPTAGLDEDTYLFGPQVRVWRFGRIADLNLKVLFGPGHISIPNNGVGQGTYFVYAPGINGDFRLTKRLILRADYEYQFWPSFQGQATSFTSGSGGITPNGFTVGINYALLPWR